MTTRRSDARDGSGWGSSPTCPLPPTPAGPGGARRGPEEAIATFEDASPADLLSGGRLELGLAGGMPGFEAVFGALDREYRDETQHRIRVFRDAIAGSPVEFRSPELIKNEPPELSSSPRARLAARRGAQPEQRFLLDRLAETAPSTPD
jgi:hypothetical protein